MWSFLSLLLSTSLSSVPVVSFSQCNLCYVIALSTGMVVLKVYSATKRKIRRIKEMWGKRSLWDIGRCNYWPKFLKIFKTNFSDFFLEQIELSKNFGKTLDRFHQLGDSFGFSFLKLFVYDVSREKGIWPIFFMVQISVFKLTELIWSW